MLRSFLIMGGVAGLGLVFGFAYSVPPKSNTEEQELEEGNPLQEEKGNARRQCNALQEDNANDPKDATSTGCSFNKVYNFGLLKKPEFFVLVVSNMIFHFGVYTVFSFTAVSSELFTSTDTFDLKACSRFVFCLKLIWYDRYTITAKKRDSCLLARCHAFLPV